MPSTQGDVRPVGYTPEKAIDGKLAGLKDAKIKVSKIPQQHGNLVMILVILRSYPGLGRSLLKYC